LSSVPSGSSIGRGTSEQGKITELQPSGSSHISVYGTNYQIGETPAPSIHHDNGFLQNPSNRFDPVPIPTRPPTEAERDYYQSEQRRASAGNIVSGIPGAGLIDSRANLDEGIDGYRHFLNGEGETYNVDYEKYLASDKHGKTTRNSIEEDIRSASEQIFTNEVTNGNINLEEIALGDIVTFTVSGSPKVVNEDVGENPDARYPYPDSENWQKAIGAHHVYTKSEITVTRVETGELRASAETTVNFEDRYNFNPGQNDIATGVPDSERGVLEETGLAQQFDQVGQARLNTTWTIGKPESAHQTTSSGFMR